tara:strand:- start:1009 stop:1218 length:210 start_codon:yes stop_codon:yes gene_type:complete
MNTRYVKVGQVVTGLYPKHGRLNVLRRFKGVVLAKAKSANGPYITVQEDEGRIRSYLSNKCVGKVEAVA